MKELSSKRFRDWLEQRSPNGSVGVAGRVERCPLAAYLGPGWRVRPMTARYVEPGEPGQGSRVRGPEVRVVQLPVWARRFVASVDALPGYGGGERRVYPRLALRLLDDIEEGIALERRSEREAGRAESRR